MYLWGDLLNGTGESQEIVSIYLCEMGGDPISEDVTISFFPMEVLPPGWKGPFQLVMGPLDVLPAPADELLDRYEPCVVEAEPSDFPLREDLVVTDASLVSVGGSCRVEGTVRNDGPALDDYLQVVVTFYNAEGLVIGYGDFYTVATNDLQAGEVSFTVDCPEMPESPNDYAVQAVGS
ncbi:MAG: hypothetical protein D6759_01005 [Chloroflexi bacterium]|nr:MAG: hypothetical protein D6759_01005 [Chloroflexota bacterium]